MSRSGYNDDCDDHWSMIRWRGAVNAAINGKRGQAFLKEMLAALDALPMKRLVADELTTPDMISCSHWGLHTIESVCALGAVGKMRGMDMTGLDPDDSITIASKFGIADAMAREIVYINDEDLYYSKIKDEDLYYLRRMTQEHRFQQVRAWVTEHIKGDQ